MPASIDFRDSPTSTGQSPRGELLESAQELKIVRLRLAEAEARVDDNALPRNPGCEATLRPLDEKCLDLVHDVERTAAPAAWWRLALHVHEAHRTAAGEQRLERPWRPAAHARR